MKALISKFGKKEKENLDILLYPVTDALQKSYVMPNTFLHHFISSESENQ